MFGTVFKATSKTSGESVAIKYLRSEKDANREALLLSLMSGHSNVARLSAIYLGEEANFLVQEYCSYSLEQAAASFTPQDVLAVTKQLASVIESLHSHSLIHRDLKPDNIMLQRDHQGWSVRLIDFGLAVAESELNSHCRPAGTDLYLAPEMIRGQYDRKVDIWALGMVTIYLMTGELPICPVPDTRRVYQQILNLDPNRISLPSTFDNRFCDLVRSLLHQNPDHRPTASELKWKLDELST